MSSPPCATCSLAHVPGVGPLRAVADRGRPVQPHLRGHRRRAPLGACAARRWGTCSPPPTTWRREYRVITRAARRPPCRCRGTVLLCEDPEVHRRAVLRDGATSTGTPYRTAGQTRRRSAPSAPARSSLRAGGRARRPARRRPGRGRARPTSAGPRATSTGSCAAGASSWTPRAAATCPGIDELHDALGRRAARRPPPASIVHGDYRLDNVLVGADDPGHGGARLGDGHPRRPAHRPRPAR